MRSTYASSLGQATTVKYGWQSLNCGLHSFSALVEQLSAQGVELSVFFLRFIPTTETLAVSSSWEGSGGQCLHGFQFTFSIPSCIQQALPLISDRKLAVCQM